MVSIPAPNRPIVTRGIALAEDRLTAPIPRADTIESPGNINKWPILAALAIISSLLIGGTLVSLSVYIPVLEHNERWAAESLGAAATALLLGMSLAGIASGIIIDRLSARYVIIGGTLFASLGCWLAGESTTAGMFIIDPSDRRWNILTDLLNFC